VTRLCRLLCLAAPALAWTLAPAQEAVSAPSRPAGSPAVPSASTADLQTTPAGPIALPPASLPTEIATLLADPAVARDHWGIMVTSLDGALIYALNQDQLFQPASNVKLFTTAAALSRLGASHHFETQVVASGDLKNGTLHGDLKLIGGGDPSFGTADLPYTPPSERPKTQPGSPLSPADTAKPPHPIADIEELADKVYASGLRRIDGDVVGDDWRFTWEPYPPDWSLDDMVYGYAAPVSALSIHDNEVEVKVSPGTPSTDPAVFMASISLNPDVPYYDIEDKVYLALATQPHNCDDNVNFQRDSKHLLVYGSLGAKEPACTQTIAIADPAEYAAMAFKAALERRGITVSGTAKAKHLVWNYPDPSTRVDPIAQQGLAGWLHSAYQDEPKFYDCMAQRLSSDDNRPETLLATHTSKPLSADVTYTLKTSQNLHAEIMLRDVGAVAGCEHTQASGLTVMRGFLPYIGIDPHDFFLVDGSGLSSHDLVTPRAIAKLLSYAARDPNTGQPQPWFPVWKASLPIGGVDGTLASRFTEPPLKGRVFAKTGTLGEARALSGYLDCASGRTVIFSIMVDNHLPGDSSDRAAMDRIVAAIQQSQ